MFGFFKLYISEDNSTLTLSITKWGTDLGTLVVPFDFKPSTCYINHQKTFTLNLSDCCEVRINPNGCVEINSFCWCLELFKWSKKKLIQLVFDFNHIWNQQFRCPWIYRRFFLAIKKHGTYIDGSRTVAVSMVV